MKYELLQEGDVIKEGDECFNDEERWVGVMESDIGKLFRTRIYRPMRRLATKPKASLEEISELLKNQAVNFNLPLAPTHAYQMAISICAHLGIELEPEREEWDCELRDLLNQHYGALPTGRDELIAKAMFEAGQACEKSKDK